MRFSWVVRASGCQCLSRNSPGFDPSILRHNGTEGRQMKQCWITYIKKSKNPPLIIKKKVNQILSFNHKGLFVISRFVNLSCINKIIGTTHNTIHTKIQFTAVLSLAMRILVSRVEKDKNGTRTSSNFSTKMTPNILGDFTTVLWHIIRTQNLWNLFSIICLNLCPICECKIRQIN
jgi:hypothetical protein